MHRRDRLGRWPSLHIGATLSPVSDPVQRPSLLGLNTERKNLLAPPLEPISATERAPTTQPRAPQVSDALVQAMAEACDEGAWWLGVQTVWAMPGFGQRRKWGLRGRAHGATA
ncbi:hypothetical protein ERO13_D10G145050v2 [Gossypium hirsutum]|uniref:Uncharacterized protein n=1 Tax=Gossypium hirsutum TaxID=3635 RepID=A0ABM3AU72_GOSHI|nr:uncharacterized protein LOC121222073 [Gossypium hirsutum]KAG4126252.1 hypothetical protein ERO13_D10G145050v2 [Gossypium hirsutum]